VSTVKVSRDEPEKRDVDLLLIIRNMSTWRSGLTRSFMFKLIRDGAGKKCKMTIDTRMLS